MRVSESVELAEGFGTLTGGGGELDLLLTGIVGTTLHFLSHLKGVGKRNFM